MIVSVPYRVVEDKPPQITPRAPRTLRMTAGEAAELLGMSKATLYKYAADGVIPAKRVGRNYFFVRETLTAWLNNAEDAPESDPEIDW